MPEAPHVLFAINQPAFATSVVKGALCTLLKALKTGCQAPLVLF
jgi:hypothetical protein